VLDEPGSFRSKEVSKLGALESIFQPELNPELYGDLYHKVRSNITRRAATPKKAGTTSTSSAGSVTRCRSRSTSCAVTPSWLLLSFWIWRCSDDLSKRAGFRGVQEWLSFYFKSPQTAEGLYPEHDVFIQSMKLKNTLRWMMGEDLITHLGNEYYD
jgi:myo-inositol-1-phosphate synthase